MDENRFSLLTLVENTEIIEKKMAIIDGRNRACHLMFIDDMVSVKIKNVKFINGNTGDIAVQNSLIGHPKKRLNIFRYLDGGAITIGMGSRVVLENCEFENNYSAICGGAISNLGGYLYLKNCIFRNNGCGDTGAAIDNLAAGSLTIIEECKFVKNVANKLGNGTHGAVSIFPNTYLVVKNCDFSEESIAVDYRPNGDGESFMSIDKKIKIVKNPASNSGVRKELLLRCLRLLINHPNLVKFEGVPSVSSNIVKKHRKLYVEAIRSRKNKL